MSSKHNRRRSDVTRLLANALLFYRNQSMATAEELALRVEFDSPNEFYNLQSELSRSSVSIEARSADKVGAFGAVPWQQMALADGEPMATTWQQYATRNSEPEITS